MSNGQMKLVDGYFRGDIRTMRIYFSFYLEPIRNRKSEGSPDFEVIAKAPLGHSCNVGTAWEKQIKRGEAMGQSMFQFQLNDPDFGDDPLYFNAFPSEDGYQIRFERKRGANFSQTGGDKEAKAA